MNSEILANEFVKAGHEVRLLTWTKAIGEKSFPFQVIRNPNIIRIGAENRWADVVFENNPCLRLAWPSLFFNKPSVVALRTWVNRMNGQVGWQDKLKFSWLARASAVIAVSEGVRKRNWPKAIVIGNPYRVDLLKKTKQVSPSSGFVFLGRLVSDKGAGLAIRAFHRLLRNERNSAELSLTIIGDGPDRKELEKLSLDLGVQEEVNFTGSLRGDSLVAALNRHRFMLVPSLWEEPFGNVALEGIACGCIPIVSNGGGLPDAVGNSGLTFERGDLDELIARMQLLLDYPDLEEKLRKAAPAHLAAHHPEVVAGRYLKVIRMAVAN